MAKKKTGRGGAREGAGRPQIHPEGKNIPKTYSVPELLARKADDIAEIKGISTSQVVADLIRKAKVPNKKRKAD